MREKEHENHRQERKKRLEKNSKITRIGKKGSLKSCRNEKLLINGSLSESKAVSFK